MRIFVKSVLALSFAFAFTTNVQAGLFTSVLTPGTLNTLQDNSVSAVFDSSGNPITNTTTPLAAGDVIVGVIRLTNTTLPLPGTTFNSNQQLSILFSAQITGTPTVSGGFVDFTLAPTTVSNLTIDSLLTSTTPPSGPGTSQFAPGTFASNTIFALLESQPNSTNITTGTLAAATDQLKSTAYSLDLTGGIASGVNSQGSTDFFTAQLKDVNGDGQITLADFTSLPPSTNVGTDSGVFTSILNNTGFTFGAASAFDGNAGGTTHTSDVAFTANLVTPTSAEAANGFAFADNSLFSLTPQAVPEPSSCILFLLGAGGLGAGSFFRRKRVAA